MQRIFEETDHDEYQVRWDDITKNVHIDVPDFYGHMHVKVFTDSITTLEDDFEWYNMDGDKRVHFVKMNMKGATRVWWRSIDERNVNHRRPPTSTWEEMKEKLEDKYLPVDCLFFLWSTSWL